MHLLGQPNTFLAAVTPTVADLQPCFANTACASLMACLFPCAAESSACNTDATCLTFSTDVMIGLSDLDYTTPTNAQTIGCMSNALCAAKFTCELHEIMSLGVQAAHVHGGMSLGECGHLCSDTTCRNMLVRLSRPIDTG